MTMEVRTGVVHMIPSLAIMTVLLTWAIPHGVFWLELLAESTLVGKGKGCMSGMVSWVFFIMELRHGIPL